MCCVWKKPEWKSEAIVVENLWSENDKIWLERLQRKYEAWRVTEEEEEQRIPKKLHQIWLGPKSIPFERYRKAWQEKHPEWEYHLWCDDEVSALNLGIAYDRAQNYGEKSDIARYHILYRFGGIYLDIDMEPVQSLAPLLTLSCFAGFSNVGAIEINNAVIGAIPNHPLLAACISKLSEQNSPQQDSLLTTLLASGFISAKDASALTNNKVNTDTIQRSGPGFFTRVFCTSPSNYDIICLPSEVFYPASNRKNKDHEEEYRRSCITPHSLALHHWACTWQTS
mmetsp:Transcript_2146/g.2832  ORF Transcript_2146/g.2832 Transcript_2146/m.2832 type:complete len:282 (+) Transcript_2146:43-888(+)